jgi:dihydroorotase
LGEKIPQEEQEGKKVKIGEEMALLIRGGRVVDPILCLDGSYDILIEAGLISKIAPVIGKHGMPVLDARGKVVVPGLIDMHVHLRDFNEEQQPWVGLQR